ncbi:MAG: DUF1573 domain-containing protein [Proteobacteria bacterium]|nr:DUF1573 domain-containing protein [Pseudomonadota bacterium]
MKKIGILCAFLLFFVPPLFAQNTPSAEVAERSFRFEPVLEGDQVLHEFIIKNTGSAPLQIIKIESG